MYVMLMYAMLSKPMTRNLSVEFSWDKALMMMNLVGRYATQYAHMDDLGSCFISVLKSEV